MHTSAPLLRVLAFLALIVWSGGVRADVIDDYGALTSQLHEATLNACAEKPEAGQWADFIAAAERLTPDLTESSAIALWKNEVVSLKGVPLTDPVAQAAACGALQGKMEYVCSLELLGQQARNNIALAQAWRALITLPKHANSIEGALALQSQLENSSQIAPITQLLAKECLDWQSQRIREKLGNLQRLISSGHYSQVLLEVRFSEISALAAFNPELDRIAGLPDGNATESPAAISALIALALPKPAADFADKFQLWRKGIEARLPSFLSPKEIARHERLLLKLVKLIPKEYNSGVRDGQVVVPLEYREAVMFIVQAQQLTDELNPIWVKTRPEAEQKYHEELSSNLNQIEKLIDQKADPGEIASLVGKSTGLLEDKFGLSLQRSGDTSAALEEMVLDIRTSLKQSLAAAQAGVWDQAESHRLDAYTTFDAEIEKRVLPRDYALGIKSERSFLDGQNGVGGIKAALDSRLQGEALEAVYQQTLDNVKECQSLLKVGLSPATVMFTTVSIVAREGLEAVVILAALLAGLRGDENRNTRRWIGRGAWLALVATGITFWLSRTLIESLSRYGETLEAIVSILAVIVLLIVTNWVFHKYYWADWNTKLRHLTKDAKAGTTARWQWLALVSVGFVTIYREGFETSLFMQSLLMEGSEQAVLAGVLLSTLIIGTIGTAIFVIGTKLPIRKMLIVTGLFVVSILFTFLGSTVRIFQTVGWLPIHPIAKFEIPTWMGQWLGLYPSWEGIIIPALGICYVGGAWLYMKVSARLTQQKTETAGIDLNANNLHNGTRNGNHSRKASDSKARASLSA